MRIGILKDQDPDEFRVALVPQQVKALVQNNHEIFVEHGAGDMAGFSDTAYCDVGATLCGSAEELIKRSDLLVSVRPPLGLIENNSATLSSKMLVSFLHEHRHPGIRERIAVSGLTFWALERIPRISRAQNMDVLSSMANLMGYRAVIEASADFGKMMGGQITAAGRIPPARVLVIGAGVAGLAAIGQARSLGAIVRAFDTRSEVKDQIRSMGAEFLTVEIDEDGSGGGGYAKVMSPEFIAAEMELFRSQCRDIDIIITTAQIPGKKAPTLITKDMVEMLKPGSVVVDLAAEQGGNCELTVPGQKTSVYGVTIDGRTDLLRSMPMLASELFSRNVFEFLKLLNSQNEIPWQDVIVDHALIIRSGQMHKPTTELPASHKAPKSSSKDAKESSNDQAMIKKSTSRLVRNLLLLAGLILFGVLAQYAPSEFMHHFMVFVLACVVGWQVIWNVAPALHTPLMSVTNAISGIIVLGGLLQFTSGQVEQGPVLYMGVLAVFLAALNIFGGFYVTQRMLTMFRRKG